MMAELEPLLDITDVQRFLDAEFPQVAEDYQILEIAPKRLKLRLVPSAKHLRPGGTVSGPTLFSIADCAVYLAIIAHVGEEALAVTTGASIDFMRKPAADADLICDVELLKLGRGLVVGDAAITSAGQPGLVARATLTYSRPRK